MKNNTYNILNRMNIKYIIVHDIDAGANLENEYNH